jgi:galactonate dehydratase
MDRRNLLKSAVGVGAYSALLADGRAAGTSRVPHLKIAAVKAAAFSKSQKRFVRVYSDQGLTGTGEADETTGVEEIINQDMGPGLAGRDPLDIEGIYFDLWSRVHARGLGGPYLSAVSAVEMALWDLAGKAFGLPIYRLMSGRVRDKIAVYFCVNDPKQAAEVVRTTGVRAIKASLGPFGHDIGPTLDIASKPGGLRLTARQIDTIGAYAAEMRTAIGPDVELAIDCRSLFDTESAVQVAKAIEPSRPMWLGEPTSSDNPELTRRIREQTRVSIACGENIYTRWGFRPFLEKQAAHIIQPDISKTGGLLETRKIAQMAETYVVDVAPHGVATPLGQMAFMQVCSTIPNFMILEWGMYSVDRYNHMVKRPEMKDGYVEVSDAPGIGAELNGAAIQEGLLPGYTLPEHL